MPVTLTELYRALRDEPNLNQHKLVTREEARGLARDLNLEAPWLEACRALLEEAAEALGPGADHTAAFAFLEDRLKGKGV